MKLERYLLDRLVNLIYIFLKQHGWSYQQRATQPQGEEPGKQFYTQDGEEVFFKIKSTTQLKKLMDAYCQRQSVSVCKYSWTWTMWDSSSTARDSMNTPPPRTSTWRTVTRSMWWSSKLAARSNDSLPLETSIILPSIMTHIQHKGQSLLVHRLDVLINWTIWLRHHCIWALLFWLSLVDNIQIIGKRVAFILDLNLVSRLIVPILYFQLLVFIIFVSNRFDWLIFILVWAAFILRSLSWTISRWLMLIAFVLVVILYLHLVFSGDWYMLMLVDTTVFDWLPISISMLWHSLSECFFFSRGWLLRQVIVAGSRHEMLWIENLLFFVDSLHEVWQLCYSFSLEQPILGDKFFLTNINADFMLLLIANCSA